MSVDGELTQFMDARLTSPRSLRGTLWTGRERDACGTGFVAETNGRRSRRVVDLALDAIERIAHRGAVDAGDLDGEPTGDGAGILLQVPWGLLADEVPGCRDMLDAGRAAAGMCFLDRDAEQRTFARQAVVEEAARLGIDVVGWRPVPVDESALGSAARQTLPVLEQVVVALPAGVSGKSSEALLYRLSRELVRRGRTGEPMPYVASLSAQTMVYKGLVVGTQMRRAFPDLSDPRVESAIAVFHQRYSTNTFPAWERAQPCRFIAHNGEINTVRGNVAWMRARGTDLGWPADRTGVGDDGSWLAPVVDDDGSDSAMLDDAVQLLVHGGRPLPETLTMLLPPAWDHEQDVDVTARDLLRALSASSEPWDGPAAVAFTDGTLVGCCLDRNGLRPARWLRTDDGLVACASETGAVPVDPERITFSGRLGPGQMLVVDTSDQSVCAGDEVLDRLAAAEPWGVLVAAQQADVADSSRAESLAAAFENSPPITAAHALHGYTREELTAVLRPMVQGGVPPVGSMGDDTPLAVLATQPRPLFAFVRQAFAEVTNPAIDPLRERATMSLDTLVGPRARLLDRRGSSRVSLRLRSPLLTDSGLDRLRKVAVIHDVFVVDLAMTVPSATPHADDIDAALDALCRSARDAVNAGADVLVLSDRQASPATPALPALLAGAAVHAHLVDAGVRTHVGLVVDSGEPREPHHVAALLGHGVDAVCPWLALATAHDLAEGPRARLDVDGVAAQERLVRALEGGLKTAMSRMGISTIDGYRGAHVFEAVGLAPELARHLGDTQQRPGSIGFAWVADQLAARAAHAAMHVAADASGATPLPSPGFYKFKRGGELHGFAPDVVAALHHALAVDDPLVTGFEEAHLRYRQYASLVRDGPAIDLRDLLEVTPAVGSHPVPLDEVESARDIVRRFSTGAMSHGSLGSEAHETLAQAAHLVGSWSNSGEGGEAFHRFNSDRNSAIKQVASGRFGVTPAYLRSARELQVKIAQGSKPGEGGHLPGHKVTEEIARIRHTQPGVSLISPPPHHDIYSIEDLAQLIHDLACVNPRARSSVKLVSQAGVGTIAAGVAKARADVIVVSGASGGTGASPLGSIKYAGMPWEWGLAETQQVLVANRLRGRVRLRADGGLRTGRDVLVAALLGADEFSFGTAALVAEGCKMARTCHNDQCPVGIATQRADLRELFPGRADQVGAFLLLVAEELRELLAALGARRLEDVIGRVELLRPAPASDAGAGEVDLTALLARAEVPGDWPIRHIGEPNAVPGVEEGLDAHIAVELWPAVLATAGGSDAIRWSSPISNMDRSVGARLSGDIAERIQHDGLASDRVHLRFDGTAGQSFGAFAIRGLHLELVGEANDFVGKGLAGASIDVRFPDGSIRAAAPGDHVLLGNACLYGATSGVLLAAGAAGERFAVRNSGGTAVIEGAGDHLCEYMTGGTIVVLGAPGRNVASGMSGGTLWVLDDRARLERRLAPTGMLVDPDGADVAELRALLELHAERTGSARAAELLADWPAALELLHCIHPTERAHVPVTAAAAGA
ncbi:MAG: glutamate synthase large subunit [Thermoleophilia bacterium]|nr:glutamate synthase large subunit [Thermoleophilia bacterium]